MKKIRKQIRAEKATRTKARVNKELDKYDDPSFFRKKSEKANRILKGFKLPK